MTFHRAQLLRRHASSLFLKGCLFSERACHTARGGGGMSQIGVSVREPLGSLLFFLWSNQSFKVPARWAIGQAMQIHNSKISLRIFPVLTPCVRIRELNKVTNLKPSPPPPVPSVRVQCVSLPPVESLPCRPRGPRQTFAQSGRHLDESARRGGGPSQVEGRVIVWTHRAAQSQQACEECLAVQTTGLAPGGWAAVLPHAAVSYT